ncbi:uncharacterized protein I303_102706 [Kwoniella dejecticola CBS 10117]|uniref:Uncharacterized protein n=1 Tax=Kwoniella dejecticola CBS 10117 TaxID=1296121 RepID=A0A1A6A9I6_9TREE|nr:uncharacterized protein I303_02721 [Kwoniella dejecticola CBS 10117]OBR86709.1 hypothetical protein I303_02721 [Kwoniella dejecticola CBS 10117]
MSKSKEPVLLSTAGTYKPAYSPSDPWTGPRIGYFNGTKQTIYTALDFYNLFSTPQLSTTSFFAHKDSDPDALNEEKWHKEHANPGKQHFNDTVHPLKHLVSFVIIFDNAHPAWEDDNEIWVHSKVDIFLKDYRGPKKNFGRPIPVFKAGRSKFGKFIFEGWMTMEIAEIVEPGSDELKRMLQAKQDFKSYKPTGRTSEAWKESLSFRWLKIKFTPTATDYRSPAKMRKGEAAKYALKIGGLAKELDIFEKIEIANVKEEEAESDFEAEESDSA